MLFKKGIIEGERTLQEYGKEHLLSLENCDPEIIFQYSEISQIKDICLYLLIDSEYPYIDDLSTACDDIFHIIDGQEHLDSEDYEDISKLLIYLAKKSSYRLQDIIYARLNRIRLVKNKIETLSELSYAIKYFMYYELFEKEDILEAARWGNLLYGQDTILGIKILSEYITGRRKQFVFTSISEYDNRVLYSSLISAINKQDYEAALPKLEKALLWLLKSYTQIDMDYFLLSYMVTKYAENRLCFYILYDAMPIFVEDEATSTYVKSFVKNSFPFLPSCVKNMFTDISFLDFKNHISEVIRIYLKALDVKKTLSLGARGELKYYTTFETFDYMLPHRTDVSGHNSVFSEINGIKSNMSNDCAKWSFMNVAYMNDPNEGKAIYNYLGWTTNKSNSSYAECSDVYLKSFSERKDDLSMWEMYGDHAEGVAVIVDWKDTLKRIPMPSDRPKVYKVLYLPMTDSSGENTNAHITGNQLNKIGIDLDEMKKIYITLPEKIRVYAIQAVAPIKYLVKDKSYWHEKESRIIFDEALDMKCLKYTGGKVPKVFYQGQFNLVFKEIMLGPKCKDVGDKVTYLTKQFEEMNVALGLPIPRITLSSIVYK